MKLPGYYSQKPQLKIIRELKKTLGYYDSIPTTIELIIIDYENKCKEKGVTPESELNHLASSFIVKNHHIQSLDLSRDKICNLYILSAFNVVDPFFRDLKRLLKEFESCKNWKTKNGKEDLDAFNQVIENCKPKDKTILKGKNEFHLINYYRLYRNAIVHRVFEGDKQFEKSDKYYEKYIYPNISYYTDTYGLDSPNNSRMINFSDFLIYTRSIKYFNNLLNDACYNLISPRLVDFAQNDEALTKKFRGLTKASDGKKQKALKVFLRKFFKVEDYPEFDSFYHEYYLKKKSAEQ